MMADNRFGISVFKREDESLKDYLLSFSPFAPMFGVPYRFAPAMALDAFAPTGPAAAPKAETPKPAPKTGPKTGKPPAAKAKAKVEEAVEVPETKAEPAPEPAAEAAPAPTPAPEATEGAAAPALLYPETPEVVDDLKKIRGVGPKLERELNGMGLYTYAQIASLSAENLAWVDENLTAFRGRSVRDDWVGQASALLGS